MSDEPLVGVAAQKAAEPWAPASKAAVSMTVLLAAISGFLFGYDTGVVSAALYYLSANQNFGMDTFDKEIFVSSCIGAAIVGSLAVSSVDKFYGRKTIVLVSAALFCVGAVAMAACPTDAFWLLIMGRSVVGLGIGLSSTIVPVYISEMAPAAIRGRLTVTNNAFCTGGQLIAALGAYGLSFAAPPSSSWRYMLGIGAIPAAAQLVGFAFMPESPRWLLLKGQQTKAFAALRRLKHQGASDDAVQAELRYMADALEAEKAESSSTTATGSTGMGACTIIWRSPGLLRLLFVGCFLQFTQQIAGINTIMYYGSQIVQAALLNTSSSSSVTENGTSTGGGSGNEEDLSEGHTIVLITAGFGFINFVFTLLGIYLADRCSRRRLTLSSLLLVVVMLAATGVAFFWGRTYVALGGCGLYLAVFAYVAGLIDFL